MEQGKQQAAETLDDLKEVLSWSIRLGFIWMRLGEDKGEWNRLETTIPQAEEMVKRNIWCSLAIASGLG